MKAIVFRSYGQPDVLALEEIEKPSPKDGEVLLKVYASKFKGAEGFSCNCSSTISPALFY